MRIFSLVFLLQLICCFSLAQADLGSLRFHFLGVKDGLPEGSVNTLLQDQYGYVWVGTQSGLVRYDGYQTKIYSLTSQGGSNLNIKKIFEDRKGKLWVSSYGSSLFYYDRSQDKFTEYRVEVIKKNEEDNSIITDLTDDSKGNVWFVLSNLTKHQNTIVTFNPVTHLFMSYDRNQTGNHYFPSYLPLSLITTGSGILLAGSENGLYVFDPKEDQFELCKASPDSLSNKRVVLFTPDKVDKDLVWLAAGDPTSKAEIYNSLASYNVKTGNLRSFHSMAGEPNSFRGKSINAVYCSQDGKVWIGSDAGLTEFDRSNGSFINHLPSDVKREETYLTETGAIQEDNKGNLWCVTNNGLLYFNRDNNQFTRYTYDPASNNNIAESNIRSFMVDQTGTVWFGAAQLGLQWANTSNSKFLQYSSNPSLRHYFPGGAVNDMAESKDGAIWLSTDNGLYKWQLGTDSFARIQLGKQRNESYYSTSVIVDKEGIVWSRASATNLNIIGLYGYNPVTGQKINYRNKEGDSLSLSNNTIRVLFCDHTGLIWIGTFGGGVCCLDKKTGTIKRYPFVRNPGFEINREAVQKKVLDDDEVQSIYEDANGILWVGTNNGGLNYLDRKADKLVPLQKPIADMHCVLSILGDGNGKLWSGTYTNGLYLIDTKLGSYTHFSEKNGLLYNGGWGMNYDNSNNLWITTPRGITILPQHGKMQNLTVANGLPQEPLNFFIHRTRSNDLAYGTRDGFVVFNPKEVTGKLLPPPVIQIESLSFPTQHLGKESDSNVIVFRRKQIHLSYDENRLTINYVGLQYQNVTQTKYQYKLEGYDNSWVNGGTQRQVTYTNLSPGSYVFRVKAINSDGVESKTAAGIKIIISPPWWETWWAYMVYVLLLCFAVWALVAYRSKKLRAQNKLLEQSVTKRTEDLNQSLIELKATQTQLIQKEKMASLGELMAGIAHEIQNPLNFVTNFSEVNIEMIEEAKEEFEKGNYEEVSYILHDIKENSERINQHGRRADAIVKGMLQHSRQSKGVRELTDINKLCDESLRLSYHGLRAKDKNFTCEFSAEYDTSIPEMNIVSQDLGRVMLNLLNNAFYAVNEKRKIATVGYLPLVSIQTKNLGDTIEIRVSDNGDGIPQSILTKVFQPFFTTKPTGQGTGLGLSLSYDIIVKEHNGSLEVVGDEGEGATFIIKLPLK